VDDNLLSVHILRIRRSIEISCCQNYLERQNFFVDAVEAVHSDDPGTQTGHVTTHLLGRLQVEIFHVQVRQQQFRHLLIDRILRELQKIVEECTGAHHLIQQDAF